MFKIGLLTGGLSSERAASLESAQFVYDSIKHVHDVQLISIDDREFDFRTLKNFDLIYPILPGRYGEDGCIQGILEFYDIPYIGTKVYGSAITMDKFLCQEALKNIEGITVPDSLLLPNNMDKAMVSQCNIKYPALIKPCSEGSSLGIKLIHNAEHYQSTVEKHYKEGYNHNILESFITGREMSVGAFTINDEIIVTPIIGLILENDFFDASLKFGTGSVKRYTLEEDLLISKIAEQVKNIFRVLQLRDIARFDLIVTDDLVYFLEVNTSPNMRELGLMNSMILKSGYTINQFVEDKIKKIIGK